MGLCTLVSISKAGNNVAGNANIPFNNKITMDLLNRYHFSFLCRGADLILVNEAPLHPRVIHPAAAHNEKTIAVHSTLLSV